MAPRGELTLMHVARPLGLSADSDWVSSWTEWATARLRKLAERHGAPDGRAPARSRHRLIAPDPAAG